MGNNNGKRLFQYALHYKKPILLALLLLLLAVGVELVGPFIAKRMIDTNIIGIEKPWYETKQDENTRFLMKTAGISERTTSAAGETKGREVRVLQVRTAILLRRRCERSRYGQKELSATAGLTITNRMEARSSIRRKSCPGARLIQFYKPEFRSIFCWRSLCRSAARRGGTGLLAEILASSVGEPDRPQDAQRRVPAHPTLAGALFR